MSAAGDAPATEPRLAQSYLLVLNIALIRDGEGWWADPLWAKDLLLHLDRIERLTLFCPVDTRQVPAEWVRVDRARLAIVSAGPSGRAMWPRVPLIAARLWSAIGRAEIVHTGVAGWPLPLGWLTAPMARARRRFLIIVIESSFWRAAAGASWPRRLRAAISERINRACVERADLALFTTDQYRRSLAVSPRGHTEVTPATWLDQRQILDEAAARSAWATRPQRLLFAGRLTAGKGVATLLDALGRCRAPLDIIGDGELLDACRALAARHPDRVRLLEPVPYGDAFSRLLDGYAGVVVPTLSDEQPRILFDAFARAVPAIASDTAANAEIVGANGCGILFARGDADALARAMDGALADRAGLEESGLRARAYAALRTHEAMHADRARLIEQVWAERRRP